MPESISQIFLGQIDTTVGDIEGNTEKILQSARQAKEQGATAVIFPELAISGYPPEDLILKPQFITDVEIALNAIAEQTTGDFPAIITGAPYREGGKLYNGAFMIAGGVVTLISQKSSLPNYGVFDERRVFSSGQYFQLVKFGGHKIAVIICEDIWTEGKIQQVRSQGATLAVVINSSPFENGKLAARRAIVKRRAEESGIPIIYLNQIGGQDEIVFDGGSFIVSDHGEVLASLPEFAETVASLSSVAPLCGHEAAVYQAMMLGLRDYARKNGFSSVAIGLSGGLDSAFTATVAVDALGAENVHCFMMPSRYTSEESLIDARLLSDNLGIETKEISIQSAFSFLLQTLAPVFEGKPEDITEENLQARIRGMILMAISNKFGHLVLTTGNKSEIAVGYSTLYGDTCGGFSVIKDLYKTDIFHLANWRNENMPSGASGAENPIPENIILKPPSAELKDNQKDEDTLPPYDTLDQILSAFIEEKKSASEIIALGFGGEMVKRVIAMIYAAEHKRVQYPPGVKLSPVSFGKDWRYPVTGKYRK